MSENPNAGYNHGVHTYVKTQGNAKRTRLRKMEEFTGDTWTQDKLAATSNNQTTTTATIKGFEPNVTENTYDVTPR